MQKIKFEAGETIITEGQSGDDAFLISEGSVEVLVGEGASQKQVATLESGDVFGEMSLIDPGPRSATVRALTDTECMVTTYDEFAELVATNPAEASVYMKTLVQRLRQMNEMMSSLDPGKQGLLAKVRGWMKSMEGEGLEELDMTEEEKQRHLMYVRMYMWIY